MKKLFIVNRHFFVLFALLLSSAESQVLSTRIHLPDWGIDSLASIRLGQISTIHAKDGEQLKVYSLYDGPYLNSLLRKDSAPPLFDSNCFVVSEFEGETVNALGGGWSVFQRSPSSTTVEYVRTTDGRIALRMSYHRAASGYCGMWMRLSETRVFADSPSYFDARPFGYLTFWIRGTTGGEEILLKAADTEWDRKEDSAPVGAVSEFVSSARIETEWQPAVVPLSSFPRSLNLAQLTTIVFEASNEGSGGIELSTLAFCKELTFLPDLSTPLTSPPEKRNDMKSIWVWNTSEILGRKSEEDKLLTFLKKEGFRQVFLALPYDPEHPDVRRMIRIDAKKFRPLMKKLNRSGISVQALTGDKDFVLPENHDFVVNSIKEVIRYNKSSSRDDRFSGVHLDVEPYLLAGFGSPRREWILENFARLLSRCADTARAGNLRISADIPAWFDAPDEMTGERLTIKIAGETKPLLHHILDLMDDVTLMDYRTEVRGENGVVAHARRELRLASERKKQVYVGLETDPLPDETIMIFRGEPLRGWPSSAQASSFVSLATRGNSRIVALVQSAELPTYRKLLERTHVDSAGVLFWPIVREYRVEGNRLSFATLGARPLSTAIEQSEPELSAYPAFSGFAIHHYGSYRKLLSR